MPYSAVAPIDFSKKAEHNTFGKSRLCIRCLSLPRSATGFRRAYVQESWCCSWAKDVRVLYPFLSTCVSLSPPLPPRSPKQLGPMLVYSINSAASPSGPKSTTCRLRKLQIWSWWVLCSPGVSVLCSVSNSSRKRTWCLCVSFEWKSH